jgi:hypothetical protein
MIRQKLVAAVSVMCSVTFLMCAALTLTAGPKPDTKCDVAKGKEGFEI